MYICVLLFMGFVYIYIILLKDIYTLCILLQMKFIVYFYSDKQVVLVNDDDVLLHDYESFSLEVGLVW